MKNGKKLKMFSLETFETFETPQSADDAVSPMETNRLLKRCFIRDSHRNFHLTRENDVLG